MMMSSENRINIIDQENMDMSEKEFAEKFRDAFDGSMYSESLPRRPLDLTFLEKEKKRLQHRQRMKMVIAAFLILFITSSVMAIQLNTGFAQSLKSRIEKVFVETGDRLSSEEAAVTNDNDTDTVENNDQENMDLSQNVQGMSDESTEELFQGLLGQYFHAEEIVYYSDSFSHVPELEEIQPYYLDEMGVLWVLEMVSSDKNLEDSHYEWRELGTLSRMELTEKNFDECISLGDFVYGEHTVLMNEIMIESDHPEQDAVEAIMEAARSFRENTIASWSVDSPEGNRSILIVQGDDSVYLATCHLRETPDKEDTMWEMLKVTISPEV